MSREYLIIFDQLLAMYSYVPILSELEIFFQAFKKEHKTC